MCRNDIGNICRKNLYEVMKLSFHGSVTQLRNQRFMKKLSFTCAFMVALVIGATAQTGKKGDSHTKSIITKKSSSNINGHRERKNAEPVSSARGRTMEDSVPRRTSPKYPNPTPVPSIAPHTPAIKPTPGAPVVTPSTSNPPK